MADRFDRSFPEVALVLSSHIAERQGLEAQAQTVNDAINFANYPLNRRSSKKRMLMELGWDGEGVDRRLLVAARLAAATFDRISQIEIEKGLEKKPTRKKRKAGKRAIVAALQSDNGEVGAIKLATGRYMFKALRQDEPIEIPAHPFLAQSSDDTLRRRRTTFNREETEEKMEELLDVHLSDDTVGDYLRRLGQTPLLNAEQEVILAKQVEAGLYAERLLSGDETMGETLAGMNISEDELRRVVGEGIAAKNHMIKANLRLVVNLVRKYSHQEMPFSDFISEANLGLVRAVEKFDSTKGFKFSTYATWWIRQSIGRASSGTGAMIRLPVHQGEQLKRLVRAKRDYMDENNRGPRVDELAEECGVSEKEVGLLLQYEKPMLSLDSPVGNDGDPDGATLGDFYAREEDGVDDRIEQALANERSALLHTLIAQLPPNEATALRLRYGLDSGRALKPAEVGRELGGVTAEWARQLEKRAIAHLRQLADVNENVS